jgi:2-octaprenyl-6-methoxyphenol hydroxylase
MSSDAISFSTPAAVPFYDAVIVGAGLAGSIAALALARAGSRVCLLDAMPATELARLGRDGRTTAIAAACADLLDGLGIWDTLRPHAEPIRAIRISDDRAQQFVHFDALKAGRPALGYIIDNGLFRQEVLTALQAEPRLTLRLGERVTHLATHPAHAALTCSDGARLMASLVVAADGRCSPLRALAGIPAHEKRYTHDALTFIVTHDLPHHGIAHERFLPEGPLAMLPLPGNQSSVVWMVRRVHAAQLQEVNAEAFTYALGQRFGPTLGTFQLAGPRHRYPLWLMLAQRYAGERLVLVGESAHALHPIAGQGLNVSLRDVAVLARLVGDNRRLGLDPAQGVAAAYEVLRRPDVLAMTVATDSLDRLFQVTFAPIRWARRAGLAAVQHSDAARAAFMRHAMGVSWLAQLGMEKQG